MIEVNKNTCCFLSLQENNCWGIGADRNGHTAQFSFPTKPQPALWLENVLKIYKGMFEQRCKILFFVRRRVERNSGTGFEAPNICSQKQEFTK